MDMQTTQLAKDQRGLSVTSAPEFCETAESPVNSDTYPEDTLIKGNLAKPQLPSIESVLQEGNPGGLVRRGAIKRPSMRKRHDSCASKTSISTLNSNYGSVDGRDEDMPSARRFSFGQISDGPSSDFTGLATTGDYTRSQVPEDVRLSVLRRVELFETYTASSTTPGNMPATASRPSRFVEHLNESSDAVFE
ncbi:hypothetical protein COCMIDRAFT_1916 [Bipolaris oryzae ATCC 44560]|uniref:Uncharacterized protein n=1 Tax=Bipolaris oryzae ATCC 44560 TaxID=930090 RepID=W6ZGU2_COCMI|nr:uncharacterized protein COCMIDRAFT_1916 [Bipolaris oryzae ATCC 44560]EUC49250.1 hypothetical protein COCMIDRAFT_1916 [Bipolaris oryzae ATCC 44560]